MSLKQRLPLLRWSVWRMGWGMRQFPETGQIGDGREAAAADYCPTCRAFSTAAGCIAG